MQFPPLPQLPEHLRGRAFAVVEAAFLDEEREADALLVPMRELAPELDTFATISPPALGQLHMDPPGPVPAVTEHGLLDGLPAEAIEAITAVAGPGSGSPLISVEVRRLGGALAAAGP